MWWIIGIIACITIPLLLAAIIRFGNSWSDHDEDYMMDGDYTDWGDKS